MKIKYVALLHGYLGILPSVFYGQTESGPSEIPSRCNRILNEIIIDGKVTLFTKKESIGHTMIQMERHPDRSIYVNGHASGLFKSRDEGET